jgi:hypothetical protein
MTCANVLASVIERVLAEEYDLTHTRVAEICVSNVSDY